MAYRLQGLDPAPFAPLFALDEQALAARGMARRVSDGAGFPCRISLQDTPAGESVLLLNHVSNDVDGPFRIAHAIYVREGVEAPAYEDTLPPMFAHRRLALRQFDVGGMLIGGEIVEPGEADAAIRRMFAHDAVATIHAHSPAYGCFLARIERN